MKVHERQPTRYGKKFKIKRDAVNRNIEILYLLTKLL